MPAPGCWTGCARSGCGPPARAGLRDGLVDLPWGEGCGSLGWGQSLLGKMSEFSMHELIRLACEVGGSSPWGRKKVEQKSRGRAPAGALGL